MLIPQELQLSRKARDTVDLEIPKAWAMSMMVVYFMAAFFINATKI